MSEKHLIRTALDYSKNPKCSTPSCKAHAIVLPCLTVFTKNIVPAIKVGDITMGEGFCERCRLNIDAIGVRNFLSDNMWRLIGAQIRHDFTKGKAQLPALDRARTMLSWRPFMKK